MSNQREKNLSKIYYIRAILSKIHENQDISKKLKSDLQEPQKKLFDEKLAQKNYQDYFIEHANDDIIIEYYENEDYLYEIDMSKNHMEKILSLNSKRISNISIEIAHLDWKSKTLKRNWKIGIGIANAIALLSLAGVAFGGWYTALSILLPSIIFFDIIFVNLAINQIKAMSKAILSMEKEKEILEKETEKNSSEKNDLMKKLKKKNSESSKLARRNEEIRHQIKVMIRNKMMDEIEVDFKNKKHIYNKRVSKISNLQKNSHHLYLSLKETTQNFLDERDWKYLDIIAYQLETGRADTIKEALQQTDLYIRHNEIKGMMQAATAAICSTIQSSIDSLSFSLQSQLGELHSELMQNNSALSDMSEKFDNLISAQELNNALLKKANVSSEKLVENLDYLKERREYQYHLTGV